MDMTRASELPEFIGRGKQGTVYRLSDNTCIKIYHKTEYAKSETDSYKRAKGSSIVPKLYESGPNYNVIEYIHGIPLNQYLAETGKLNKSISRELLFILSELKRLGFSRIDAALFHIYLTEQGKLKIIDLVNSNIKKRSVPLVMLGGLKRLGMLEAFYEDVKEVDYALYRKWKERVV